MGFKNGTWNFFESSHGKGAPDGVGGALKRLGNHLVAHGLDIPNAETFYELVKDHTQKIKLFYVSEADLLKYTDNLPITPLATIQGTRQIHQIITFKEMEMFYRSLSCFCAENDWACEKLCNCFFKAQFVSFDKQKDELKGKKKKSRYYQIYDSSSESEQDITFQETDDEDANLEELIERGEEELEPQLFEIPSKTNIVQGAFIIVELLGGARKKLKHKYAAVVTKVCLEEEDGDYSVMFLIKQGKQGNSYIADEKDESIIDLKQVKVILPQPKIVLKGLQRVVYEFPFNLERELV
ncbi:uncharacterized protein LOC111049915 [Nilaparvata lugens]|uniref:uncharacterized protein LOC111049915 n=1 Tax=Nilaparvata lugens TaxID=108931 RepID=UPI00193D2DF2|nr:uncharacterized protein LOC111049915 [Nilaparvata lugens]